MSDYERGVLFLFGIPALLGLVLGLWQWIAAVRFPLHQRVADASFRPPVSLLKPLKGLDEHTLQCLESWLTQENAGEVQVLFGVASPDDPVCGAVRELLARHPAARAELLICPESFGANAKVSTLIQLSRRAAHEVIVVSDADVRVPADFLRNAVAPLRDPNVGLVNCFYRLANPVTLAMRWEALAVNADFWSQVLQGKTLAPLDFALGAVMITRRAQLTAIGGFEALANHLADDFQLGNRIFRAGASIALCPVVVDCLTSPQTWGQVWAHQLRWARTIRVSKPLPYAASIISNATLWPLLWLAITPGKWSLITLGASLVLRIASAYDLEKRLCPEQRSFPWLAPIKDLLQTALWASAFLGHHVTWRGQRFRLRRDGTLLREH